MTIEQEIEQVACRLLKACADDYGAAIWRKLGSRIIQDVKETAGDINSDGFTDGDVALAIGRAIVTSINAE